MIAWVWGLALAAEPAVELVLAPSDARAKYRAWAASKGMPEADPMCVDVASGDVLVCLREQEGDVWRWVAAGPGGRERYDRAVAAAKAAFSSAAKTHKVASDTKRTYVVVQAESGAHALVLVEPEWVRGELKLMDLRVGVPTRDVSVVWAGGDRELDHMVAVTLAELKQAGPKPLSAAVYGWNGAWSKVGEAIPKR